VEANSSSETNSASVFRKSAHKMAVVCSSEKFGTYIPDYAGALEMGRGARNMSQDNTETQSDAFMAFTAIGHEITDM
jgi:hypothetical protein